MRFATNVGLSLVGLLSFAGCGGDDPDTAPGHGGHAGRGEGVAGVAGTGRSGGVNAGGGAGTPNGGEAGHGGTSAGASAHDGTGSGRGGTVGASGGGTGVGGDVGVGGTGIGGAVGVGGGASGHASGESGSGGESGEAGTAGEGGNGGEGGVAAQGATGATSNGAGGGAGTAAAGTGGSGGSTSGTGAAGGLTGGTTGTGGTDSGGTAGTGGAAGTSGTGGGGCDGECCVRVAPDGDDVLAVTSAGQTPFASIAAAITYADTHRDVATSVCVAGGSDCSAFFSYPSPASGDLTMRNGISVNGSYESTGWTTCTEQTTGLELATAAGVGFGNDITSPTTLSGFKVVPYPVAGMTGVTVAGARQVRLERLVIQTYASDDAIGVEVSAGGDVTIERSTIAVALAMHAKYDATAFGVRSIGGRVSVRNSSVDVSTSDVPPAWSVWLESSPGSEIDGSTITATAGPGNDPWDVADYVTALHVTGNADGLEVHGSAISATSNGAGDATAIELLDCAGSGPWVHDNTAIVAQAAGRKATALASVGPCHPRVERNLHLGVGGAKPGAGVGVHCAADADGPSLCSILDNQIQGGDYGQGLFGGASGIGILCEAGSCTEIRRNTVIGLAHLNCTTMCMDSSYGIVLDQSRPLVDANNVSQGCGDGAGLWVNADVRIQNNYLTGTDCGEALYGRRVLYQSFGLQVAGGFPDVHSNRLDGAGAIVTFNHPCQSGGATGSALYRNNIFLAGKCPNSADAFYGGIFENNQFGSNGEKPLFQAGYSPSPEDPYSQAELKLKLGASNFTSGSLIDTGTPEGAPDHDFEGNPRSAFRPDVGPIEYLDYCPEHDCSGHGLCEQLTGQTAGCVCGAGYMKDDDDPFDCVQDACYQNGGCDPLVTCTRVTGGRACGECPEGYVGSGEAGCVQIGPCMIDNGGCDPLTLCTNTPEGASCGPCPLGYEGTAETGCDLDQCATDNGGCDLLTTCANTVGSRMCGSCPPGNSGSGETGCSSAACANEPCQMGAICLGLSDGGHSCDCPPGVGGADCELLTTELSADGPCGLLEDGTMRCWGGAPAAPSGTFTHLISSACGLRTDGTIGCAGSYVPPSGTFTSVATQVPGSGAICGIRPDQTIGCSTTSAPPAGTFEQVVVGGEFACARRTDKTVACWAFGGTYAPFLGDGTFQALAAGDNKVCGLREDGTVTCSSNSRPAPAGTFQKVVVGSDHACALATDGSIVCWGFNTYGQLDAPSGAFRDLWATSATTCATRTDGTLMCWGYNASGWTLPKGPVDFIGFNLAGGCARTQNGRVECWGMASTPPDGLMRAIHGRCRVSLAGEVECLMAQALPGEFKAVAKQSCAVRSNGALACWSPALPSPPSGSFKSVEVDEYSQHACAIGIDARVNCWGDNTNGQTNVPSGTFVALALSSHFACALGTDQTLACWGDDTNERSTPPPGTFVALDSGQSGSCALRTDGTLACWGGTNAQLNPPAGTFLAVAVGEAHACAIGADHTVQCWGSNFYGEGSAPSGTFDAITAFEHTSCGLRTNRKISCWGATNL